MNRDAGSRGGLHIIIPPQRKVAAPVTDYGAILPEALDILTGIREKSFIFEGGWPDCFAIAQPQVSPNPLRYFVLNDGAQFKEANDPFGGLVIVNPILLNRHKLSKTMFRDACMSWPYTAPKKVKRYGEIEVSYDIIKDIGSGNPHKPSLVEVRNKLLTGMTAMVFQHELEHLDGKTIYGG